MCEIRIVYKGMEFPQRAFFAIMEDHQICKQAEAAGPSLSDEWFAEYNMLKLEQYTERGLPNVYGGSVRDWLWDFWADFPWNTEGQKVVVNMMLQQADRFARIREAFLKRYNYDMQKELEAALTIRTLREAD